MIDLFFCLGPDRSSRSEMVTGCLDRWCREPGLNIHVLPCLTPERQRERRIEADERSASDVYILADDDCFPKLRNGDITRLARIGLAQTSFPSEWGIVSLMPSNATIHQWLPEVYKPLVTHEIMEHVSVGGIRFCRKGYLEKWPPQTGRGYDRQHADALRLDGYRVGYFRNHYMVHLGEGNSTVWG